MANALSSATHRAKEAYRLLMTRGNRLAGLSHDGEGYRWNDANGVAVILRRNGAFDAAATKAANAKPAAPRRSAGLVVALALAALPGSALAAAPDWAAGKTEKAVAAIATQKECGRRWQAGKAGRIAAGETWQAFAKDCRASVRPAADECVKASWPATDMCLLLATGRDQ